jgi:hypothetical protein
MSPPESHNVFEALQAAPTLGLILAIIVSVALPFVSGGCSESSADSSKGRSISDPLSEMLIRQFIADRVLTGGDQISPFYAKIISRGSNAVPALIQALGKASPEYQEKRSAFIFMLGHIGDSRAYETLLAEFVKEKRVTARRRIAISLGASLSPDLATRFPDDILSNAPQEGSAILEEVAGVDLGADAVKWREFFSNTSNLKAVIDRCRTKSKPILG